jgi:two-component system sensor histidine kinase/response regulator
MFERLQELLQQMRSTMGEGAVVLTEDVLSSTVIAPEHQAQRFTVVVSERFSALLLGTRQAPELLAADDAKLPLYQVGLTFEPEAIAAFLTQLAHELENHPVVLNLLNKAQASLQPNDAAIQSEFTLSLIEMLSAGETTDSVPSDPIYSDVSVCKPLVEEALRQQVEQERLLHQVTTHIRESLELPVILKTAVEEVRQFLQVDRLLIYQFDDIQCALTATKQKTPLTANKTDPSTLLSIHPLPQLPCEGNWGCVTYEARASDDIPSVLNLIEEEDCSTQVPNCREKYHRGLTFAVDDVETGYTTSSCFLELLRQTQVRAKLVAPIVVQNDLWGLLIAHQCFEPRQWQDSEKTFLKLIAEHLTVAIYQAQLYAQLQQQKTTLEQQVIERTQELRDALQAAQAANRAKGEFLAAMSHELRTPLTCVIGMSATLLRWSFGQGGARTVPLVKQRRYLKTIQESGEHLLELINDILDLSQVEAGKGCFEH